MAIIVFERRHGFGRGGSPMSDLRVYAVRKQTTGSCVALRLSLQVMKRLRWKTGDTVRAEYDNEAKEWSLQRVTDKKGNRISCQGKKDRAGTVRFVVDQDYFRKVDLAESSGYDCSLVSDNADTALFRML